MQPKKDGPPDYAVLQVTEPKKAQLKRTGQEALSGNAIEGFSRMQDTLSRVKLTDFVRRIFGAAVFATFGLYLLQGFGLWGFDLPTELLHYLGVATVGEIVTLAVIAFRYYFGQD